MQNNSDKGNESKANDGGGGSGLPRHTAIDGSKQP